MAEIKDLAAISAKWASVTPDRDKFYKEGVLNPKRSWEKSAVASEEVYKKAIKDAADEGRYGRGVKKAGEAKWQTRASTLGPSRFREGVQVAEGDHMAGYAPFHAVVQATKLPERFPTGDPRNIERVKAIATAQHNKRLELLGARK